MIGTIRRQLIFAFVLFAAALGTVFGLVTLLVFHRVEDRMISRRLNQMILQKPAGRDSPSIEFVGSPKDAPTPFAAWLQGLEPGIHEWEHASSEAHALIAEDPTTGAPVVALASFPESEASQSRLAIALLFGIAATAIGAVFLARYLAVRIVSPIEQLTEALEAGAADRTGFDASAIEALASDRRTDEVGTLARSFERASTELAASAERERRFLREASHELRTPITIIQGVSDLLRESIDTDDSVTQKRLDRLSRSLRRMNTSVLSLLAMARAEHRVSVRDVPPFAQQLDDLVEEARAMATGGVTVHAELRSAPQSMAEGTMLLVVLSNLTRNAVQHTESGCVRVVVEQRRVQVSDDGPGLPAALLEQLRTDGPQPDIGIGLATAQRICRRFGWTFTVTCPSEGGTRATISL